MSAASDALANGWALILSVHGETDRLGYIASDNVVRSETGEAITNETADAILSDDTQTVIDGIIDEGRILGLSVSTTDPIAIVNAADVAGVERGAVIVRRSDSQKFYVQEVWEASIDGSQVLLLTKDAH